MLVALTDRADGRLRLFELGEILGWEKSRLSHHVARMADRGLVAKQPCEEDRRGSYVVVTKHGRKAIEAAAPGHVATVAVCSSTGSRPASSTRSPTRPGRSSPASRNPSADRQLMRWTRRARRVLLEGDIAVGPCLKEGSDDAPRQLRLVTADRKGVVAFEDVQQHVAIGRQLVGR